MLAQCATSFEIFGPLRVSYNSEASAGTHNASPRTPRVLAVGVLAGKQSTEASLATVYLRAAQARAGSTKGAESSPRT